MGTLKAVVTDQKARPVPLILRSYPTFVKKEVVVEGFMAAMRLSSRMDQSTLVLLNSVLAIGCQNALRRHHKSPDKRHRISNARPLQYFQWALNARHVLTDGQPSILKLQVRTVITQT